MDSLSDCLAQELISELNSERQMFRFRDTNVSRYNLINVPFPFIKERIPENKSFIFIAPHKTQLINNLLYNYRRLTIVRRPNSMDVTADYSCIFILFKLEGLIDLPDYLIRIGWNIKYEKEIRLLRFDIQKYLDKMIPYLDSIARMDRNITLNVMGVDLYEDIRPNKYRDDHGIPKILPREKAIPIKWISVLTDHNGNLSFVRLSDKHPNADKDNWYCLGGLKTLKLTYENLTILKENIKIYRLDECYWNPFP